LSLGGGLGTTEIGKKEEKHRWKDKEWSYFRCGLLKGSTQLWEQRRGIVKEEVGAEEGQTTGIPVEEALGVADHALQEGLAIPRAKLPGIAQC
jgi:hypothetical protein